MNSLNRTRWGRWKSQGLGAPRRGTGCLLGHQWKPLSESMFVCTHIHLHEPPHQRQLRSQFFPSTSVPRCQNGSTFFCPLSHPESSNPAFWDECPIETCDSPIRQRWLPTDPTHPFACPLWIPPCLKFYIGVIPRSSHLDSEYFTNWTLCVAPGRLLSSRRLLWIIVCILLMIR